MPKKTEGTAAKAARGNAGGIVAVIFLILLLAALGCGIAYAIETNGFTRFEYITQNGKRLGNRTAIPRGETAEFKLKDLNPFDGSNGKISVKIYANEANDFQFTVEENRYSYKGVGELTECFEIETGEEYFRIALREECRDMRRVLAVKYGKPDPLESWENDEYFIMSVTTDRATYTIAFEITGLPSGNIWIELEPPSVVF